jgi:hypothetical protein
VFNTARKAGGELLDLQTRTKEGVKFEAKTVGGTAAWRWETSGARPYHLVILDPDFTATCDRPSRPSRRTLCEYGAALLRHEKWHGLITDRDLDTFVRSLARRLEHPTERAAILAGKVRFSLSPGSGAAASPASGTHRVERGAVTERIVERAAAAGHDLVLGPKAVLTPMGKDRARALGVQIQRETAC